MYVRLMSVCQYIKSFFSYVYIDMYKSFYPPGPNKSVISSQGFEKPGRSSTPATPFSLRASERKIEGGGKVTTVLNTRQGGCHL